MVGILVVGLNRYFYPLKYKETVVHYCEKYGVDKALAFSVIKTESDFNPYAESEKGAKGLMQITDNTANYIATLLGESEYDLFDETTNIRFGVFYLSYLKRIFKTNTETLCAYNAGEGRVRGWLKNSHFSADGKTLNKIPFAETEGYVKKTCKSFRKYQKLYGDILDKSK